MSGADGVLKAWLARKPFYVTVRLAELHRAVCGRGSVLRTVFMLPSAVEVHGAKYLVYIEGGKQARVWLVREDVVPVVVPEGVVPIDDYRAWLLSKRPGAIIAKAVARRG